MERILDQRGPPYRGNPDFRRSAIPSKKSPGRRSPKSWFSHQRGRCYRCDTPHTDPGPCGGCHICNTYPFGAKTTISGSCGPGIFCSELRSGGNPDFRGKGDPFGRGFSPFCLIRERFPAKSQRIPPGGVTPVTPLCYRCDTQESRVCRLSGKRSLATCR